MSWLPTFVSWPLATAAAVCAAGPVIIHLLNRRRFRTVEWAAMEYLLQAVQRNRKILRIRDLILLVLRTLAVLLVGLGIAQPFFTADQNATFDGQQPLHAIMLLDNSQSMSAQGLEGTMLDIAKKRAIDFINELPEGSRVTVAPVCGSQEGLTLDAFRSIEHAEEAIQRVEVVSRAAAMSTTLNLARAAWEVEPALAKRMVLLTDMQGGNWLRTFQWDEDKPLQVLSVRDGPIENAWVAEVSMEDGVADVETPATIAATIRYEGRSPQQDVQVTLKVDGQVAAVATVDLAPNSVRQVTFQHLFNAVRPEPGQPRASLVEVSLPPDRLPADDARRLVVHVVASLPVAFVDRWGDREDVLRGRIGESRHLRTLLAPGGASDASMIKVRHLRPEQLDRDAIADTRLVVLAGVAEPGPWADLLLEYVQQGGQLFLAAGGEFQPERWTASTYQDGRHLLPLPLQSELVGSLPSSGNANLRPFSLDYESLRTHDYFQIAGVAEEELRDLYSEPLFFQTAAVDESRLDEQHDNTATLDTPPAAIDPASQSTSKPTSTPSAKSNSANQTDQGPQRWVAWPSRQHPQRDSEPARVLARYDRDRLPFMVEREVGGGRVVLVTTGMLAEWSTLPRTNAILMMDRVLRGMIHSTLPLRNFITQERLSTPLPILTQGIRWELVRPDAEATVESLAPGFIGRNIRGLTIERPLQAGVYRLIARSEAPRETENVSGGQSGQTVQDNSKDLRVNRETGLLNLPLAIECPAEESQLAEAPMAELAEKLGNHVRLLGPGDKLSMSGVQTAAHDMWWWLVLAAFGLLLIELLILTPLRKTRAVATADQLATRAQRSGPRASPAQSAAQSTSTGEGGAA